MKFTSKTTVKSRMNILSEKIGSISGDKRTFLREELRSSLNILAESIRIQMAAKTPRKPDEDSDIYSYREAAWEKYGQQDYIYSPDPSPSVRLYGMHLADGWQTPKIDFIGSNKNTIRINATFENIAPHAKMALLGQYSKSSWEIPSNGMYGGRKVMMWQGPGGRTMFRWVDAKNPKSANTGPITFYPEANINSGPLEFAEDELAMSSDYFLHQVMQSMKDYFNKL